MDKITFMGAGSTVFAKNVLGDCMVTEPLREFEYALYDIDPERLEESYRMLTNINKNSNGQKAVIVKYTDRLEALRGAKYVINAIQVGGYEPCTLTDFEIPKKYGLRQTIGDTVGIGGIFRALRTIPVMLDFMRDMEKVCPDALFLNYTNPMAMLTMAVLRASAIKTVGICHSVQVCVPQLLYRLGLPQDHVKYRIAGINHMAWLLEITRNGEDYYPEIKRRAAEGPIYKPYTREMLKDYPQLLYPEYEFTPERHDDLVRFEIMKQFGCYVTESSEHNAEFMPYFIRIMITNLVINLAFVMKMTLNYYYTTYTLGDVKLMSLMSLITLPSILLGTAAAPFLTKLLGKKKTLLGLMIANLVISTVFWLIGYKNIPLVLLMGALQILCVGASFVVISSMTADTIEYGEYMTGQRNEGVITSTRTLITKVASALVGVAVAAVLTMTGYVPNVVQSAETMGAFHFVVSFLPGIVMMIGAISMFFYSLTEERHAQIMEELKDRRAEKESDK